MTCGCALALVSFGGSLSTDYILGMAKSGEGVKILLDIDRVLYEENVSTIQLAA